MAFRLLAIKTTPRGVRWSSADGLFAWHPNPAPQRILDAGPSIGIWYTLVYIQVLHQVRWMDDAANA